MATVRLCAATLPWQCEIPESVEDITFGFSSHCTKQLPAQLAASAPHLLGAEGSLFILRRPRGLPWTIERGSAVHPSSAEALFFNGRPLDNAHLNDGDILTLGGEGHLLVNLEGEIIVNSQKKESSSPPTRSQNAAATTRGKSEKKDVTTNTEPRAAKPEIKAPPTKNAPKGRGFGFRFLRPGLWALTLLFIALIGRRVFAPQNFTQKAASHPTLPLKPSDEEALHETKPASPPANFARPPSHLERIFAERQTQLDEHFALLARQFADYLRWPTGELSAILAQFEAKISSEEHDFVHRMRQSVDNLVSRGERLPSNTLATAVQMQVATMQNCKGDIQSLSNTTFDQSHEIRPFGNWPILSAIARLRILPSTPQEVEMLFFRWPKFTLLAQHWRSYSLCTLPFSTANEHGPQSAWSDSQIFGPHQELPWWSRPLN